jgi:glycosyltransferase involved in cell wall biosynthesis
VESPAPASVPLVLHVIPTTRARGAQREARALRDRLDAPGTRRHRLLSLVTGGPVYDDDVAVDYGLGDGGGAATTVGFDPRVVLRLRRTLGRLAPSLVVAHGGEPLKYVVPATVGRRCPVAYYAIGTLAPQAQSLPRRTLWRYLVNRSDLVAACGPDVLSECRDVLGVPARRLVLASNCRDPGEFRPPSDAAPRSVPVIAFVGALTAQKRPDRFIDVVAAVRAGGQQCRALMVGDGPLGPALESAARAAGVEMLGARADVADVLRGTDLVVFPSLPRGKGMPGVLIEAGLSAVPVVATAVPGVDAIVADGDTGRVVGIDDFAGLVDATADLLGDAQRRAVMGKAARARCRALFSVEAVAKQWTTMLAPLLAEH